MNAEVNPKYLAAGLCQVTPHSMFSLKGDPEQCTSLAATQVFHNILLSWKSPLPEKKKKKERWGDFKNHYTVTNYSGILVILTK